MLKKRITNAISKLKPNATRRRKQKHIQTGQVQALEERTLPAGNVLASFRGGNLTLRGDNFSNDVEVLPTAAGIRVQGIGNTTVNGAPFQDYTGSQFVPKNLKAVMKGGDDRVGVFVAVNNNVTANMGGGADLFTINGSGNQLPVAGNLKVNTGSTSGLLQDQVFVINTNVFGNATIKGGSGTQVVNVQNSGFQKTANFNLGSGNFDTLNVSGSGFFGAIKLNGGGGTNDTLNWAGANPPSRGFEILI